MKRITFFWLGLCFFAVGAGAQNYFPHDSGMVWNYQRGIFHDSLSLEAVGSATYPYRSSITIMIAKVLPLADGSEMVLYGQDLGAIARDKIIVKDSQFRIDFLTRYPDTSGMIPRLCDVLEGDVGSIFIDSIIDYQENYNPSLVGQTLTDTLYAGPYTVNGVTRDTVVIVSWVYTGVNSRNYDTVTVLPRQTLTVPAGTFNCMVTRHTGTGNSLSVASFLGGPLAKIDWHLVYKAENIGVVREVVVSHDYPQNAPARLVAVVYDLSSYNFPFVDLQSNQPHSSLQKKASTSQLNAEINYDLRGRKIATSKAPTFSGIRICASETALAKPYCRVLIN